MAKSQIYVGLEIGTTEISVVVGEVKPDGAIKILGVATTPSRGVRKGEIIDFETAQTCLHDALVRAEDRSDVMIRNVFLSITGGHIESLNNRGCLRMPDDASEITEEDVEEVKNIARDVSIPKENVFLHSVIQHYHVDGQNRILDPIGRQGDKLEADYHIIHGIRNRIQNSIRCVREIPLEVEDVIFAPLASAQVVLNREAKERGALMIDIGGGTTDYVLYRDGVIVDSGCIPVGGDHVTNDIAAVLKIPLSKAEKLKCEEGCAIPGDEGAPPIIYLADETGFVGRDVEREVLDSIINARLGEVLDLLYDNIDRGPGLEGIGAGVFLTGGSSRMLGLDRLVEEVFRMPVHRSKSTSVSGLTATFEDPRYSTAIGLIRYAQIQDAETSRGRGLSGFLKDKFGRFLGKR